MAAGTPAAATAKATDYPLHERDPAVLEPFRYLLNAPGKDVRGKLIDAWQVWLKIPEEIIEKIKKIVGELHNASLLVDDIEDGSELRRGLPVAHSIFGVPLTMNCANYVYFLALEDVHRLGNDKAMGVFVSELLLLHRGQGQDILWRDMVKCPTEPQYRQMVLDKTGGLFRLAVGLMQAFADPTTPNGGANYTPLVENLALYFQIRDDLINLQSDVYMQSKSFCEDLTEGKFSYPIIHAIRADPLDTRLISILKQRTTNVDVKRHAVEYMRSKGSFEATREVLKTLFKEIEGNISALGGHKHLSALLHQLDKQVHEGAEKSIKSPVSTPVKAPKLEVEGPALTAAAAAEAAGEGAEVVGRSRVDSL